MNRTLLLVSACSLGAGVLTGCADQFTELPATLDNLVVDTLFEVGVADGEAWESFQGVWDVEVDADGRMAVLDLGGPAVHVYDAEGEPVGSIDERGLEEGQLDRPSGIAWSRPGELLVWDPGSSWISRFGVGRTGLTFRDRWRAFAFGETGFCASGDRTFVSYFQAGTIVHELGPEGPVQTFGEAPAVVGADSLGLELQEIATEELTPSALLCTDSGVLDVSFVQSLIRFHDSDGSLVWHRPFDDFRPIEVYSDDGVGLGRAFDPGAGSHLLRSVVPWGDASVLVQHELRTREIPEEGEAEVLDSRLIRIADGQLLARSRELPLILAAVGRRLYVVQQVPFARISVVEIR